MEELSLPTKCFYWDSKAALVQCFRAFSKAPLAREARAWGAFPYEDEQAGTVRERLTAPYELSWKNVRIALTYGEERFLPESWNVLWHGAQPHMRSVEATMLRYALRLGRAKKRVGYMVRRLARVGVC